MIGSTSISLFPYREAEDVHNKEPHPLALQLIQREERPDPVSLTKDLNSVFWECIGRKPAPVAGYIYRFKFRQELHSRFQEITEEIYPAVEPCVNSSRYLKKDSHELYGNDLRLLGYSSEDDGELRFPDKNALLASWPLLQKKYPYLPDIKIVSSKGIASDREFIEAFFKYDFLISSGKEFIHDHQVHILRTIIFMLGSHNRWRIERYRAILHISSFYRCVLKASCTEIQRQDLLTILGLIVDVITNANSTSDLENKIQFTTGSYPKCLFNQRVKKYAQKRFGNEKNIQAIIDLWEYHVERLAECRIDTQLQNSLHNFALRKIMHAKILMSSTLDLSGMGLKQLPTEIKLLTFLEVLNISDNQLCELPDVLAILPWLKTIHMKGNPLVKTPSIFNLFEKGVKIDCDPHLYQM